METMAFATSTSKVPYHSLLSSPVRAVTSTRSSSLALKQKNKLPFRTTLRLQSPSCASKLRIIRCGAITEIKESEFSDVVSESSIPVLVEFVATWCGPCRLIKPAMESIAQEYKEKLLVVKVDHDSNPKLIEEYKVYGLPTLILFKDGKEVPESRREGAITKVKLKAYIDGLLETVSVA